MRIIGKNKFEICFGLENIFDQNFS